MKEEMFKESIKENRLQLQYLKRFECSALLFGLVRLG
jgi:hypothetical protein